MSFRSSAARTRKSPVRIIAGVLFASVVVAGTLSVRSINANRAQAANTIPNQSAARDIQSQSADGFWSSVAETDTQAAARIAVAYGSDRKLSLNTDSFTATLAKAPLESATQSQTALPIVSLPQADGTFMRFATVDSPILAPELAARYP